MRSRPSRVGYCVAVAATALAVLAGCGGDGDDTTAPTGEETAALEDAQSAKAAFIAEADRTCGRFQSESENLQGQLNALAAGTGNTREELVKAASLLRQLADIADSIAAELRELEPPPEDVAEVNRYLSSVEAGIQLIRDLADAYEQGDQNRANALAAAAQENSAKADQIAQDYGFEVCGKDARQ